MKKTIILVLLVFNFLIFIDIKEVKADTSYTAFQTLTLEEGKLLSDFTESEYETNYKKIEKRRFMGWRTYDINKNVKAKYISKTVFSYYNSGTSRITYTYNLAETETSKFSVSVSGSISYSGTSTGNKSFKHSLQTALKIDTDYQSTSSSTTKENLDIIIDPGSVATLKIMGEGYLTNGVGAHYFFWIRTEKGGYEYFIVSTEYPRLEVLPI